MALLRHDNDVLGEIAGALLGAAVGGAVATQNAKKQADYARTQEAHQRNTFCNPNVPMSLHERNMRNRIA